MDLSPAANLKPRVALLIDGDSFPRSRLSEVESKAARLGDITIRRVFADMAQRADWAQDTTCIATHCCTSAGKNRADMALVIAAMDFGHRGLASTFVIASDDRDFDPLVTYMREQGFRAERIGNKDRPAGETGRPAVKAKPASSEDKVVKKVRALISAQGGNGYPIQLLGVELHKQGITVSDTAFKTWRAWLTSYPETFDCDPRGPEARVRLKT